MRSRRRVGDLFDVVSGGVRGSLAGVRYASLTEAHVGRLRVDLLQPPPAGDSGLCGGVCPSDGDILFGTVRPLSRSHFVYDEDAHGRLACSHGFVCLRPRSCVDPTFAVEVLLSRRAAEVLHRVAPTGAAYPKVTTDDVLELEVSVPDSVDVQQRHGRGSRYLRTRMLDAEEETSGVERMMRCVGVEPSPMLSTLIAAHRAVVDSAIDQLLWEG